MGNKSDFSVMFKNDAELLRITEVCSKYATQNDEKYIKCARCGNFTSNKYTTKDLLFVLEKAFVEMSVFSEIMDKNSAHSANVRKEICSILQEYDPI